MTADEAGEVMKIATAGAVARDLEQLRFDFLTTHLLPLPYRRTRDSVHRYVAGHKWVSSLEELLDACGLPHDDHRAGVTARTDLVRAVRDGGRLVPDLRAVSGWAYVPRGAALPPGAAEAERVAAAGVAPLAALPPARRDFTPEERRRNLARLGTLSRVVADRRAALPAKRDRLRAPKPSVSDATIEADLQAFEERRGAQGDPQ